MTVLLLAHVLNKWAHFLENFTPMSEICYNTVFSFHPGCKFLNPQHQILQTKLTLTEILIENYRILSSAIHDEDSVGERGLKNLKELFHICQQALFKGVPSPQPGFASWLLLISASPLLFYIWYSDKSCYMMYTSENMEHEQWLH